MSELLCGGKKPTKKLTELLMTEKTFTLVFENLYLLQYLEILITLR